MTASSEPTWQQWLLPRQVVVGIDPGATGAVVVLDLNGLPVGWLAADAEDGYHSGGEYQPGVLAAWLRTMAGRTRVALVAIERQQAMPMQGRTSALTTGYGWGLVAGVVATLGLPCKPDVSPSTWSRSIRGATAKGDRKAASVRVARERCPYLPLTWGRRRKPHSGLADACCLALWARAEVVGTQRAE